MNAKKLIIVVLFIITVVIAILAIYLISALGNKPVTLTTTPTPTITVSVTPSQTETPVPTGTAVACGASCTSNGCQAGSTCIVVSGFRRCVSDSCISKETGGAIQYVGCTSNFCLASASSTPAASTTVKVTPVITQTQQNTVTIAKTSRLVCQTNTANKLLTVTITVKNNASSSRTVNVLDDLSSALSINYLKSGTISSSGAAQTAGILWQSRTISSGGTLTLSYQMIIPLAEVGKTYSNNVLVTENGVNVGNNQVSITLTVLPCTALKSDQIAFIAVGLLMIMLGAYAFKLNLHYSIGQYLWMHGLKNMTLSYAGFKAWIRDPKQSQLDRFENKVKHKD